MQSQRRIRPVAILALLCLATSCVLAKSPDNTGTLDGKLTDWHSVPLAEAVVVVRNLATGETSRGITGKNGSYRFTGLNPGEYRIEAEVPQLGKGAVEGILVSAGHATRVQAALVMELPVPPQAPEITVHELDPVTPAVTTMIASEELTSVPIATRNWQEFAAITPAAHPDSQMGNGGQLGDEEDEESESLSLNGRSASQTAGSIDGMESTPGFHAPGGDRTAPVAASAVLSMQARTGNSPADEGRGSNGGAIRVTTNRGGNGLHGQIFYLNRQSLFGARNPFTQWVQQTAPASGVNIAQFTAEPYSPERTRQTFGVGIGSEIRHKKLFWFAAVDGLLDNDPAVATVRHPTDFFAQPSDDDLTMLAARLTSPSAALLPCTTIVPGPAVLEAAAANYSCWLGQLDSLLGPVPRTEKQFQGFARADWQATDRQHLSVEANAASLDAPAGAISRNSETYGSHSFGNSQASDLWGMARLDSFLTPNLLHSAAALYRRHAQSDSPQTPPPQDFESQLLPYSAWGQLPEIVTDSKYGFTYDVVDKESLGPIRSAQITVPLYTARPDPNYQQLASIESRANSTYDAALVKIVRYGSHGLSLRAHYLYSHATDWNPNESGSVSANDVLDPANFGLEYGTSNLDIRHSAGATVLYETPWKRRDWAGYLTNGWRIAAVGQYRSGLPFTMRTSGYIPGFSRPLLANGYSQLDGVAPGMNASGGDNRVYGMGSDGVFYNPGRNSFRYPATWSADARFAKRFEFAHHRELELLAESFNLFNHQNVTRIETTGYTIYRGDTSGSNPTLNFLTGLTSKGLPSTIPEFGKPLDVNATNFYRPREFQFGLRARF